MLSLYFQLEDFPTKNVKSKLWREGLSKTLEPVGHNFHVSVQVADVVAYLHFEN